MAMYFNVATSNGGNYCYNADVENNKVMNIEVLNNRRKISLRNFSNCFTHDDQNRLASKEEVEGNADKQRWRAITCST